MGWILPKGGIPELAHTISRNLYGKPPQQLTKPEQDIVVAWIAGRAPVTEAEVRRDLLKAWVEVNEDAGVAAQKTLSTPAPSSTTQTRSVANSALGVRLAATTSKPKEPAKNATSPTPWAAESNKQITMWEGALTVDDRATFGALAKKASLPGAGAVREMKFIITGASTSSPQIAFLNTNAYEMHHAFAKGALGSKDSLAEFNARAYFAGDRDVVCGSVVAVDKGDGSETLALQFQATDPMTAPLLALTSSLLQERAPFLKGQLVYNPQGQGQLDVATAAGKALGLPVVETSALLGDLPFAPLNVGVGFGVLRVMDGSEPRPATAKDVVVFTKLPNDVAHTAGVITVDPQTPLSHVNLKAKQNSTPNAYIKDAADLADLKRLEGSVVRFEVTAEGYTIRAATQAEATEHLEQLRPKNSTTPPKNLSTKDPAPLSTLDHSRLDTFGAKAVNAAELQKILPPENRVDGVGVPFDFYDAFMKETGLNDKMKALLAEPRFQSDETYRNNSLKKFRRLLRDTPIPPALQRRIDDVEKSFPPGTTLRLRSSTNNEDLEGFNGAGLYASRTWDPNAPSTSQKGSFADTMKDVWSSLWSFRAVEERTFHKIDHFATAMGVLVHPSYGDKESVAGVAISKNIYDPKGGGLYVNVQPGDDGVTSPEHGVRPEELLLRKDARTGRYETHRLQQSSKSADPLLTKAQQQELAGLLEKIEAHFRGVYGKYGDEKFAMDVEFVVDAGRIRVVQARPWVDG